MAVPLTNCQVQEGSLAHVLSPLWTLSVHVSAEVAGGITHSLHHCNVKCSLDFYYWLYIDDYLFIFFIKVLHDNTRIGRRRA